LAASPACAAILFAVRSLRQQNQKANSALTSMAKFFLALIVVALATLIGALVFAAFTL
jgi:hypothetical protein